MRCGLRATFETLEREREMRATFRAGHGVDLVDDHSPHATEHAPAANGRQQDVERFRRRNQDVRRLANHARSRRRSRVAGAHRHADFRKLSPAAMNRSLSSASGSSRLRWMSLFSALSGDTYRRWTRFASGSR